MTWNYRIVKKRYNSKEPPYYEIHEVHYNENGEICAITEDAIAPYGETIDEMEQALQYMMDACKKPILVESEIKYADWDCGEDKEQ